MLTDGRKDNPTSWCSPPTTAGAERKNRLYIGRFMTLSVSDPFGHAHNFWQLRIATEFVICCVDRAIVLSCELTVPAC